MDGWMVDGGWMDGGWMDGGWMDHISTTINIIPWGFCPTFKGVKFYNC
jgi:hypothetical protein